MHTTNWTELGDAPDGLGVGLVSGPGSRWTNDNWMELGGDGGRGELALEDRATMVNGNFLTVGQNGGHGVLTVSGGSNFNNGNWTEVGETGRGELIVTGIGSKFANKEWMEIGGSGTLIVMNGTSFEASRLGMFPGAAPRGDEY